MCNIYLWIRRSCTVKSYFLTRTACSHLWRVWILRRQFLNRSPQRPEKETNMLFQRQGYSGGEEERAVPGVGQGVQGAGERGGSLLYTVPEVWTSSRNLQAKKFVLPEFDWISQFSVYWKIRFYRLKTWENSFCHLGEDTSSWFWSYFRAGTSHGWFSRQWLTSGDLLQP